ncbi:MAG: cation diffusion facilitator family transporter [Acidimicrobiales bacterium]|nr:cation diffusion facilitator family transporter [Acidimicrobiales bacterium]
MGNDHAHPSPSTTARLAPAGAVLIALAANTVLAVAQVVFGLLLGSIALIADSVHQITDVVGLGIALVAIRLAAWGVTRRNTWGWGRADVLGALFSAVLLLGSSVWIVIEATRRLLEPAEVHGWGVIVLAVVGLVVNSSSAMLLARVSGGLATRAAVVHLVGDAAGSAGVLVAGAAVLVADAAWVDPAVAVAIALWVAWSGWQLLRSSTRVLMHVVPPEVETADVADTLESVEGVTAAHHLHLWEHVPGDLSLSAHLEVEGTMEVHESQTLLDEVRRRLHDRHGIDHTTFEVECHPCDDLVHGETPDSGTVSEKDEQPTSTGGSDHR